MQKLIVQKIETSRIETVKAEDLKVTDEEKEDKEFELKSRKEIKEQKRRVKFWETNFEKIRNINDLVGRLPSEKERIKLITQKQFNAFAIVLYLLSKKKRIDELYLTTFRIDLFSVEGILKMVESGEVGVITVVVSNLFDKTKKLNNAGELLKTIAFEHSNIRLLFCNNHTKIMAARIGDECYTVEGSGNLTSNARIEFYGFEKCKEGFGFHKEWIEELISDVGNRNDLKYIEKGKQINFK